MRQVRRRARLHPDPRVDCGWYGVHVSLERKTERWAAADLITVEQAERIRAFEKGRSRPTLLYAIAGLGGLAIAIGLVSIVASNWDAIPGRLKVAVAVALVAAAGAGIVRLDRLGPRWVLETVVLATHGLVLATIALVGQVYQLGGQAHEALTLWLVLTALKVTRARHGLVAWVWVASLEATWIAWIVHLVDNDLVQEPLGPGPRARLAGPRGGRGPDLHRDRPGGDRRAHPGRPAWREVLSADE